jgi:PAS domain S-box-containing protein
MESQSYEVSHKLRDRLERQSNLFYRISSLDDEKLTTEELLDSTLRIMHDLQQRDTENVAACIHYRNRFYKTPNYRETSWFLSSVETAKSGHTLTIKVYYKAKAIFPAEEQMLLDSIAATLISKLDRIVSKEELEKRQAFLDKAYKLARIGTWEYDMVNEKLYWSTVTKEVHGFDEDYIPDVESTINLFKEGFHRETFARATHNAREHEKPFDVELKIVSGKGDERWIRATGEPEYNEYGICTRFYGISQNVTGRRQAEEELQLNERRFKALVQDGSDLIAILDDEANYKYVSPTSKAVLGIAAEDFIGKNALDFIHADDKDRIFKHISTLAPKESVQVDPFRFVDGEGNWKWLETTITNLTDDSAVGGFVANSRDITERQLQQDQIVESLKEKETLLSEIHHRVKNNLAVITGMLQLQAMSEENGEVLDRLNDSISRIRTMSSIHEHLYQSKSFSKLELDTRIRQLVLNIQKSFQTDIDVEINFRCDPLKMNINQALPCSLIVNEIVTNIFKHAFKNRRTGKVDVILRTLSESEQIYLAIADNGTGMPEDFNPAESSSLGLTLIKLFSQQLHAEHEFTSSEEGTTFTLTFAREQV